MYNKVFLIGNLTRDPELRYTPSGLPVVRFSLAVNRVQRKGSEGEAEGRQTVDFINIVAWRRLAEVCGEFLKKGSPVAIEGRLQLRTYEKDGEKRTAAEVVADGMQMLSRKPQASPAASEPFSQAPAQADTAAAQAEEELPF
jgi:single-strand DNA-binding protein